MPITGITLCEFIACKRMCTPDIAEHMAVIIPQMSSTSIMSINVEPGPFEEAVNSLKPASNVMIDTTGQSSKC